MVTELRLNCINLKLSCFCNMQPSEPADEMVSFSSVITMLPFSCVS